MAGLPKNEIKTIKRNTAFKFTQPSKTKQEFKDDCDINKIVARYLKTGYLPPRPDKPIYMDTTTMPLFQDAMNKVTQVDELFNSLPSSLRERFNFDPVQLVTWASDPANAEEAAKLGLLPPSTENLTNAPKNGIISAVSTPLEAVNNSVSPGKP